MDRRNISGDNADTEGFNDKAFKEYIDSHPEAELCDMKIDVSPELNAFRIRIPGTNEALLVHESQFDGFICQLLSAADTLNWKNVTVSEHGLDINGNIKDIFNYSCKVTLAPTPPTK